MWAQIHLFIFSFDMKRFLIYAFIIVVPILTGIGIVNYVVDPAHVLNKQMQRFIADGIGQGYSITNLINQDERIFKRNVAEVYSKDTIDYLILGPSQIMTITSPVDSITVLNLGVSACRIQDYLAFYEICKEYGIHYVNVLVAIDPSLFNEEFVDVRWKSNSQYYYRFKNRKDEIKIVDDFEKLFSVSYFQEAIKSLQSSEPQMEPCYTKETENINSTYDCFGSLTYGETYREMAQSKTDSLASNELHGSFANYNSLSMSTQKDFELLFDSLRITGANIYIVESPYHPMLYDRLMESKGFCQAVEYIEQFAVTNNIRLCGTYNPSDAGLKNESFYDGAHMKKEIANEFLFRRVFHNNQDMINNFESALRE